MSVDREWRKEALSSIGCENLYESRSLPPIVNKGKFFSDREAMQDHQWLVSSLYGWWVISNIRVKIEVMWKVGKLFTLHQRKKVESWGLNGHNFLPTRMDFPQWKWWKVGAGPCSPSPDCHFFALRGTMEYLGIASLTIPIEGSLIYFLPGYIWWGMLQVWDSENRHNNNND